MCVSVKIKWALVERKAWIELGLDLYIQCAGTDYLLTAIMSYCVCVCASVCACLCVCVCVCVRACGLTLSSCWKVTRLGGVCAGPSLCVVRWLRRRALQPT